MTHKFLGPLNISNLILNKLYFDFFNPPPIISHCPFFSKIYHIIQQYLLLFSSDFPHFTGILLKFIHS